MHVFLKLSYVYIFITEMLLRHLKGKSMNTVVNHLHASSQSSDIFNHLTKFGQTTQ